MCERIPTSSVAVVNARKIRVAAIERLPMRNAKRALAGSPSFARYGGSDREYVGKAQDISAGSLHSTYRKTNEKTVPRKVLRRIYNQESSGWPSGHSGPADFAAVALAKSLR
jgi:hypothetical protein